MTIKIADIQRAVAAEFVVPVEVLLSQSRKRAIARPRQIAMYLADKLTNSSLPRIGKAFDRDHSTVVHAIKATKNLLATSDKLPERVRRVERNLIEEDARYSLAARVHRVQTDAFMAGAQW